MIWTVFTSQLYQPLGWLHYKNQGAFLEDWGINAHGGGGKAIGACCIGLGATSIS